ncbi:MAG: hypothetical protein ACPGO3_14005 [Magnetospiraceae bacterium]
MMRGQEALFLDYVHRLKQHVQGRRLLHVHVSRLQPYNRRDHHLRAAADIFDPMVSDLLGQLFVVASGDLLFAYKTEAREQVSAAVDRLRFLFGDDPLMVEKVVEDRNRRFCSWYNLETEYDTVLDLARDLVEDVVNPQDGPGASQGREAPPPKPTGDPFTPALLSRMEAALERSDLSNLVRRQYVCSLAFNRVPEPQFSELFISISDLRETVLPNTDLTSSPWLFRHLTETLDARILSMLSKTTEHHYSGDISINLNVGTILAPSFLSFDDSVIAAMRGNIILELQLGDIFADIGAYLFARAFVADRGYRVCVDGITRHNLRLVDRERLGADLVKIAWDPAFLEAGPEDRQAIADTIHRIGSPRVILHRCDSVDAVDFGQTVGISLFQGRHIEQLIADENRRAGNRVRRRGL